MSAPIRIHILHCGSVQVDESLPFRDNQSRNPLAFTGIMRSEKHQVILPVSAYLIEHPKGLVLIDTGWDIKMRTEQKKQLGLMHYKFNKARLPEGQAIHEQLAALGISPSDLDFVILSHLHTDHVSGLTLVRDAKKILTSEEELAGANSDQLRYVHHMWKDVNLQTFNYSSSAYGPQKRSFDLFGDDSILLVHAPGHSLGLSVTLIQNKGKFVLLAADCGYGRKSWEQMILPGLIVDRKKLLQALQWEHDTARLPNCVEALANHDTDIEPHIINL